MVEGPRGRRVVEVLKRRDRSDQNDEDADEHRSGERRRQRECEQETRRDTAVEPRRDQSPQPTMWADRLTDCAGRLE